MRPYRDGSPAAGPFSHVLGVAALMLAAGLTAPAAAQTVKPSTEPGRIERRLQPQPTPSPAPAPTLPELRTAPPPAEAEKIKFRLAGVVVDGATVYKPSDFLPLYKKYLDTEVSLATVYKIAEEITAKYRNDGYILSQAIVPAQKISNGIVHIQVVEGFVDHIEIQNQSSTEDPRIRAYADKIRASRPLRSSVLERYLLLANDLPGVSVRTVVSPSDTTPGAANLTLIVSRKLVDGSGTVDNRGTRYVGPIELTAAVGGNDLFGFDERLSLNYVTAPQGRELKYYNIQLTQPVGTEGTTVTASASLTRTRPGYTLKDLELLGRSQLFSLDVNHPFLRSRTENLSGGITFDYQNSHTDIYQTQLLTEDKLRVLRANASYNLTDSWDGFSMVKAEVSHGFNFLGATKTGSENLTRSRGVSDFTKITLDASRLQRISPTFNISLAVSGQKSADALLSAEEFGVGGTPFGSAYDSSEITGDDGLAGRIELQHNAAQLPSWLSVLQLYGFYDVGKVWNRDPGTGESPRRSLASAGVGTRFSATSWLSGSFEVAQPLTRVVDTTHNKNPRAFFSLTAQF